MSAIVHEVGQVAAADERPAAAKSAAPVRPAADDRPVPRRTDPAERLERLLDWVMPMLIGVVALGGWLAIVRLNDIPHYVLPGPDLVGGSLWNDWSTLLDSWWVTVKVCVFALALAVTGGVGLAMLFTLSRWIGRSFYPYAVILQVTPVVAIAPLIIIYVDNLFVVLLICAWLVAFFPILSNTTQGLNSADHNLLNLFQMCGANKWQVFRLLRIPGAMPYFLTGFRISGGLALIGAIVAEFVAGTAGSGSGLAYRILESGYRLNIPRMFAALIMISATGILIFAVTSFISHLVLHRWHESAIRREN